MKLKLFLLTLLSIGFFSFANAQYVNETPIREIETEYIRVWPDTGALLSSKISVRFDWGQGGRIPQITDERRRVVSFNGMIDVLNMLRKEGFELIQITRASIDETEIFYLKRKDSQNLNLN